MKNYTISLLLFLFVSACTNKTNEVWPQFRGINASGSGYELSSPPVSFEDIDLDWKIDLKPGVSSPVVTGKKLIITTYSEETKELQTICLNRKNGKVMWESSLKPDTIEKYNQIIASPAQSTPVTDGERIISYSGSCGLICYDMDGKTLWKYYMPCNKGTYGNAASPVICGEKVFLIDDVRKKRCLLAIDKTNGKLLWTVNFKSSGLANVGGDATPVIYKDIVIVHRVGEVAAYSISDGTRRWSHRLLTQGTSSPIIADNKIVAACWYNTTEENQRAKLPDFKEMLQKNDLDKDRKIDQKEIPGDMPLFSRPELGNMEGAINYLKGFLWAFDTNKDKEIDEKEWTAGLETLKRDFYKDAGLIAIDPDLKDEISDTALLWRVAKNAPEVPSPIFFSGRIYMVKDGGILTCVNPETGEVIYNTRLGNPGGYLASPIAANGNLYFFGFNGKLTIVKAGDTFNVIGRHDFKENIAATPAIIGKSMYIRTKTSLLAYSN